MIRTISNKDARGFQKLASTVSRDIVQNVLQDSYFLMSESFRYLNLSRSKTVWCELERQNRETSNGHPVMIWGAVSKKVIFGPYFYENVNMTGSIDKSLLLYMHFRSFVSTQKKTFFSGMRLSRPSLFICFRI